MRNGLMWQLPDPTITAPTLHELEITEHLLDELKMRSRAVKFGPSVARLTGESLPSYCDVVVAVFTQIATFCLASWVVMCGVAAYTLHRLLIQSISLMRLQKSR
ncbi:hypothetical protein ABBQ38_008517 [Trebouxia sp. C0009 RCD-2024]